MVNLEKKILDQKGKVVEIRFRDMEAVQGKEEQKIKIEEMTVGYAIQTVLLNKGEDTKPESQLKRYQLFKKVVDAKEVELSKEEKDLITKLVSEKLEIIVAGQVYEELNK